MKDPLPWPNKPVDWNTRTGGYAKDMLLRDYFAAKAMQTLLIAQPKDWPMGFDVSVSVAAYQMADAMLKAREA